MILLPMRSAKSAAEYIPSLCCENYLYDYASLDQGLGVVVVVE
jgi:hypothetical protein